MWCILLPLCFKGLSTDKYRSKGKAFYLHSASARYWVTIWKSTTKHPLLVNRFLISRYMQPLLGNGFSKRACSREEDWSNNRRAVFSVGPCRGVINGASLEVSHSPVSNTSTVTLRVVGGDEKGSLESETVKYGHKSHGIRTRKCLRWRGSGAIVNDRPVLSSERAPHINKPAAVWQ
jgi:hypothetical protein